MPYAAVSGRSDPFAAIHVAPGVPESAATNRWATAPMASAATAVRSASCERGCSRSTSCRARMSTSRSRTEAANRSRSTSPSDGDRPCRMLNVASRMHGKVLPDTLRRSANGEIDPTALSSRCRQHHVSPGRNRKGGYRAQFSPAPGVGVVAYADGMTQHIDSSLTAGAQSEPSQSNTDTPEDIQVAQGDDAEGAIGSASPAVPETPATDRPDTL